MNVVDLAAYRRRKEVAEERKREMARLMVGSDNEGEIAGAIEVLRSLDASASAATGLNWRSGL